MAADKRRIFAVFVWEKPFLQMLEKMKIKNLFVLFALLFVFASALPISAEAFSMRPSPSKVTQELKILDNAIGEQFQALVTNGENTEVEPQETFGTRSLGLVLTIFDAVRVHTKNFATNFADLPQVGAWFEQQYADPLFLARWINIGELLIMVLSIAIAGWMLTHWLLTSPRQHFVRKHNQNFVERLGSALGWFLMALLPLVVFIGSALIIMNESNPPRFERLVVMSVIYAVGLQRLVKILANFILAPRAPRLRLISLSDSYARYFNAWIKRISFVMVFGYFCVDVARLVRIPAGAITTFSSFIGLVIVVMAIIIIIQKRSLVALLLRGDLPAYSRDLTMWQSLRLWLAKIWHQLAISYLVIGYSVTMFSVGNGFDFMLKGTILTLLALIAMRLALIGIAHMSLGRTSNIAKPVLRSLLRFAVWFSTIAAVAASWGFDVVAFIYSPWGQRITGSAFSITITVLVATFIYESLNSYIERKLNRRDASGKPIPPSSRALTLLPMSRSAALILLISIVILMALSELGVNIAPLLAGAGVIGVAIGFGSQSLVKDFITGLFMLMEDAVAIGDTVKIGDNSGTVESMTIRTIRLRAFNGDLHILPFGEVTRIINSSKDFAYAVMDLGVAYDSDLRKVMSVIKEVGEEIRAAHEFGASILDNLEMFGVEQLADSSVVIRCRTKTLAGKQHEVRREFLIRVKERFDKEGIEIPYPTVRHISASAVDVEDAG